MTHLRHVGTILRHRNVPRAFRHYILFNRSFHLTATTSRGRNVLDKYQRPVVPDTTLPSVSAQLDTIISSRKNEAFGTSSTVPTGTSFQEIPKPSAEKKMHVETPIPAMRPAETPDTPSTTGPLETSQTRKEIVVQGVPIPPKPRPPGEEECCMSGCVHCVYTIYADDLETYTEAIDSARTALLAAHVPKAEWPNEVGVQDGGEIKEQEEKKVEQGMDPSMAAFLALENKLKKHQAPDSSAAT